MYYGNITSHMPIIYHSSNIPLATPHHNEMNPIIIVIVTPMDQRFQLQKVNLVQKV